MLTAQNKRKKLLMLKLERSHSIIIAYFCQALCDTEQHYLTFKPLKNAVSADNNPQETAFLCFTS